MPVNGLPAGFQLDQAPQVADSGNALPSGFELDDEKYGSPTQQAIAGAEGLAKGVAGPFATAAEVYSGITTPEAIRGREEANPITHGLGEAVGFGGSMLTGVGEGALVGKIGEAIGAGLEGASTISKIASAGVKTGAEMAALQASNEVSKMITQDPNQSIGTAAINIGLSGIMGGAGGAVVGAVSPLWKAGMEKIGVPKLLDDAKAQYDFRKSLPSGGDVPAAITSELSNRVSEVEAMRDQMGNLKAGSLARAMPEVNPENSAKIDAQVQDIASMMTKKIEKAADNAYLKGAVPKLAQDFQEFLEVATKPDATYVEKFDAIDALKRAQQAKSKYSLTAEDTALGSFTKDIARDLRLQLEDSKVWGEAGNVQKDVNSAIKASIDAEKDAIGKFTQKSAVEGGRVVDPNKVQTLVNQTLKNKAGLKTNAIQNYLEHTDSLADTINQIHTDAGLEAPIRMTPTPALNHTLGRSSPGTTLGNWLFDKGLATAVGHAGAEAAGAGLGSLVGHPVFGAMVGERLLAPTLTSLAKPLLESASHSEAFKGSLDYVMNVVKGEKLLNNAVGNFFKAGAEVIPSDLIPNVATREKLEKSVDYAETGDNALNIGGGVGHYLPNHASAAAATASTAINYLKSLKPTQTQNSPLDKPTPKDPVKQAQYERALSIAQQPLMVLKYAKEGTLQPQDIKTLNVIYPGLLPKIASKAYEQMIQAKTDGNQIPYKQRVSLSLLMGKPLDSTMTQASMQAIMAANAPKQQAQPAGAPKKPSKATASSMQKFNQMYSTPDQAREAHRTSG